MLSKNKHSKTFTYTGLILVVALTIIIIALSVKTISFTNANYVTSTNSNDKGAVADFICDFETVDPKGSSDIHELALDNIKKPGDQIVLQVNVKNHHNNKVCETAQHVDIAFKFNGSMPLTANIQETANASSAKTIQVKPSEETSTGVNFNFDAKNQQMKAYTITITWPKAENDIKYANGNAIAELAIEFVSTQID